MALGQDGSERPMIAFFAPETDIGVLSAGGEECATRVPRAVPDATRVPRQRLLLNKFHGCRGIWNITQQEIIGLKLSFLGARRQYIGKSQLLLKQIHFAFYEIILV